MTVACGFDKYEQNGFQSKANFGFSFNQCLSQKVKIILFRVREETPTLAVGLNGVLGRFSIWSPHRNFFL